MPWSRPALYPAAEKGSEGHVDKKEWKERLMLLDVAEEIYKEMTWSYLLKNLVYLYYVENESEI